MSSVDFKFFISYQAIVIQRKNKEFQMRQKDLYLAMKGLIRLSKPKIDLGVCSRRRDLFC